MSMPRFTPALATLALAAMLGTPVARAADLPGHHPAYVHALSDLRHALWNLTHGAGDAAVDEQERVAIAETERAIAEAGKAAAHDGENAANDKPEDAHLDHAGALHHAQDLLAKAKQDVSEREDNPEGRRVQEDVMHHIDLALEATRRAIRAVEQHR